MLRNRTASRPQGPGPRVALDSVRQHGSRHTEADMRNLTEVEAAQILGEIARERTTAGKPRLTEGQAAQILRAHRQVRSLPEVSFEPLSFESGPSRVPAQRRPGRLRRATVGVAERGQHR